MDDQPIKGDSSSVKSFAAKPVNVQSEQLSNKKFKILVMEDEVDARDLFQTILTQDGDIDVELVENGQIGLEKMSENKYDMVLLDILMPVMDGITVLKKIREQQDLYGNPKILMLTNIASDSTLKDAKLLQADGYVMKVETEPEELLKVVKSYLI